MKTYREKSRTVEAIRVPPEHSPDYGPFLIWLMNTDDVTRKPGPHGRSVYTVDGYWVAKAGDWIVLRDRRFVVMQNKVFKHLYEPNKE